MHNLKNLLSDPAVLRRGLCALLTGWLTAIAGQLLFAAPGSKEYYAGLPLWGFGLLAMGLAAAAFCLPGKETAHWAALAAALVCCITAAWQANAIGVTVGACCAIALVVCWLGLPTLPTLRKVPKGLWIAVTVMGLAFTALISTISILRFRQYLSPCYDFGIFAQMYEYMLDTGLPLTTCERDGLLSHFAVHVSPSFYLLLPFYALAPCPETLLVLGNAVIALGVVPLVLICRRRKLSEGVSLLFAAMYLLYPCFTGGGLWYLHENNLLAPLVLWVLWAADSRRPFLAAFFAILLCGVKEDAAVYVAVIALYLLFDRSTRRLGLGLFVLAIGWFVAVTGLLNALGEGVMTYRYDNYANAGEGLFAAVRAAVQDPLHVLGQCFTDDKWTFLLQTMLPLGLLPLVTRKPAHWVLWIPYVLVNLMSNYGYQHHVGFQYGFGSGALLLYLAVINYADLPKWRRALPVMAVACGLIVWAGTFAPQMNAFKDHVSGAETRQTIDTVLDMVPEDASVTASTFLLPHLADHPVLYEQESTKQTTEYYVLDLRFNEGKKALQTMTAPEYEPIAVYENTVALLRRQEP